MAMKYICFDNGLFDAIVTFPDSIDHSDMRNRLNVKPEMVVSAGFVTTDGDGITYCYGQSVTLKVVSRPEEDTRLLHKFLD